MAAAAAGEAALELEATGRAEVQMEMEEEEEEEQGAAAATVAAPTVVVVVTVVAAGVLGDGFASILLLLLLGVRSGRRSRHAIRLACTRGRERGTLSKHTTLHTTRDYTLHTKLNIVRIDRRSVDRMGCTWMSRASILCWISLCHPLSSRPDELLFRLRRRHAARTLLQGEGEEAEEVDEAEGEKQGT